MPRWNLSFKSKGHLDNLKKTCIWCYTVTKELADGETDADITVQLDFFYDSEDRRNCRIKNPDDYDDTKGKPEYPDYSYDSTQKKAYFDKVVKKGEKSTTICLIVECKESDCESADNEKSNFHKLCNEERGEPKLRADRFERRRQEQEFTRSKNNLSISNGRAPARNSAGNALGSRKAGYRFPVETVWAAREEGRLSQLDLARAAGGSQQLIAAIETGRTRSTKFLPPASRWR